MATAFTTWVSGDTITSAFANNLQAAVNKIEKGTTFFGGASTGTADDLIIELDPDVTTPTLIEGKHVFFYASDPNTGPTTLTISDTADLVHIDGSPLVAGEIQADQLIFAFYDGVQWLWLNPQDHGIYGDASDSSATPSDATLTGCKFYQDYTIGAGVDIDPDTYIIFINGTLTINATGIIGSTGAAGSGATGGAGGTDNYLGRGSSGGNAASAGVDLTSDSTPGAGGVGGQAGGTGALGGATNSKARWAARSGRYELWAGVLRGGTGGGGGVAGGGTGSGGGAGGPVVIIFARHLAGTGTIFSRGGAGANGVGGTACGAGGGGGGLVMLFSQDRVNPFTMSVSGGAGGTGPGGDGASGASGLALFFGGV